MFYGTIRLLCEGKKKKREKPLNISCVEYGCSVVSKHIWANGTSRKRIIIFSLIHPCQCWIWFCSLAPSSLAESNNASSSSLPSVEKLPDASMLLSSPSFSSYQLIGIDHSSRVVATMAESGSRKRESNGSGFPHPRSKLPRSSLPHSRNVPDTLGGLLVPPQLNGRLVHILFF